MVQTSYNLHVFYCNSLITTLLKENELQLIWAHTALLIICISTFCANGLLSPSAWRFHSSGPGFYYKQYILRFWKTCGRIVQNVWNLQRFIKHTTFKGPHWPLLPKENRTSFGVIIPKYHNYDFLETIKNKHLFNIVNNCLNSINRLIVLLRSRIVFTSILYVMDLFHRLWSNYLALNLLEMMVKDIRSENE